MSTQTHQPPSTATASQDASTSSYDFLTSTFISLFSSSGPSGDWFKLFVIGGVLELTRRLLMYVWRNLVNQFWITIVLEEWDDTYSESDLSLWHSATSLTSHDQFG